jgi:sortase A
MTRAVARRARIHAWVRHAPLVVFVLAVLGICAWSLPLHADIPDPGWVVTATSPTTNLVDGQAVTINVKARTDVTIVKIEVRECRLDATFASHLDVIGSSGKCPDNPVSSSSSGLVSRGSGSNIATAVQTDTGATLRYKVGVGTTTYTADPASSTLTCDPDHSCALVVELTVSTTTQYWTTPLTFVANDPIAGCGGAAAGSLTGGASDQMSDAWASWTQAYCKTPGAAGAPTTTSFPGEGPAVQSFAAGTLDLAYTAAGYDAGVGLLPAGTAQRNAVAVPIALNAAVVGVGGGFIQPLTHEKAPYPEIRLKASEIAALFGGGTSWVLSPDLPYASGILTRNPILNGTLYASTPATRALGPAEAESSTWFMTDYLTKRSPNDWVVPFTTPTTLRSTVASLATADPSFASELDLYSGRPVLNKVVDVANNFQVGEGGVWAMTDLVTAKALGMTPASIENTSGDFVAPTAATMAAAVSTMRTGDAGLLLPDPNAVSAPVSAADVAYPLTYVVYALVPAEPLVDETTCTARTNSQTLLTNWLNYVLGAGQQNLPAGMQPLTPDLLDQAKADVPKVGASPVTGACASAVGPSTNGGTTSSSPGATTAGFPSSSIPGAISSLPSASASAARLSNPNRNASGTAASPYATPAAEAAAAGAKDVAIAVPAFAGHKIPGGEGGVLALIGIVLITSLAAWITARGTGFGPSPALAGASSGSTSFFGRRSPPGIALLWATVIVVASSLVVYEIGPLLQERDQRDLLSSYRVQVRHAAAELSGLPGATAVTKAPDDGSPVGILEIGRLQSQEVAVEGVAAGDTAKGPGHVPGTAGLGQPGNSVVVARRNGFGGSFANIGALRHGDRVLVTTTQGQSVYAVRTVSQRSIGSESGKGSVTTDALYGPSKDDRLTLVTSASRAPWNTSQATVVVARMMGKPFPPTPQGGRTDNETGQGGDGNAWPALVLALLLYAGAVVGSVLLYARMRFRVAYILTIAPLVALTVLVGGAISRLLPAWT